MFKLNAPSIWCNIPFKIFFPLFKTVLNLLIFMPFSALLFFVPSFPYQQGLSLWGHFSSRKQIDKQTKSRTVWDNENREGGTWGLCCFFVIKYWTVSVVWASKSPIMKWANVKRVLRKKTHWSWTQPLTTPPSTLIQMGSENTRLAGEPCSPPFQKTILVEFPSLLW